MESTTAQAEYVRHEPAKAVSVRRSASSQPPGYISHSESLVEGPRSKGNRRLRRKKRANRTTAFHGRQQRRFFLRYRDRCVTFDDDAFFERSHVGGSLLEGVTLSLISDKFRLQYQAPPEQSLAIVQQDGVRLACAHDRRPRARSCVAD